MRRTIVPLLSLALAAGVAVPARAQTGYTVTRIVPRTAWGALMTEDRYRINPGGQISGWCRVSDHLEAFRWDPVSANATDGTLSTLGRYRDYKHTAGLGLNPRGDVVGSAGQGLDRLPAALFWPVDGAMQYLGGGDAGRRSQQEAVAINSSRDILIAYYDGQGSKYNGIDVSRVIKGKRTLLKVGDGSPEDFNDAGQVLTYQGTVWTPTATGTTWTASTTEMVACIDLNEIGEVAGQIAATSPIGSYWHPSIYLLSAKYGLTSGVNDLWDRIVPVLPPQPDGTVWFRGSAFGLNDNGAVIGDAEAACQDAAGKWVLAGRAVWLWDPANGPQCLNTLLGPVGWTPTRGYHQINNAGQIVCTATDGTTEWVLLLTPTSPAP